MGPPMASAAEPTLPESMPASGPETKSSGERANAFANPLTSTAGVLHADTSPLTARVLVQKHITVQTEVSSMSAAAAAMPLPGGAVLPGIEAMESPMSLAAIMETGSVFLPDETFAATTIVPQATPTRFESARVEMGVGMTGVQAMPPVTPENQPHGERSQQSLLDRLNSRPDVQQQESGGRRVHIGNLHITVQRPAIAQAPPFAPSAQPQSAAAAPQTFFNPWERLHTAFD